jgi:hypothetical protein
MFWNSGKIIEALATIKANTANHKDDLKEFKENFDKHIDKEEKEEIQTNKKIDQIHSKLQNFECPHNVKIEKIERRLHDSQKIHENRRITDIEERAKEKAIETKERAEKDKKVAEEIASLKTTRKYNYLSASGIYIILGVILKKLFTP